jgi:hypothetical protein
MSEYVKNRRTIVECADDKDRQRLFNELRRLVNHFVRRDYTGDAANSCIMSHSAATCSRSVGSAPIETRAIHLPFKMAGVRYA